MGVQDEEQSTFKLFKEKKDHRWIKGHMTSICIEGVNAGGLTRSILRPFHLFPKKVYLFYRFRNIVRLCSTHNLPLCPPNICPPFLLLPNIGGWGEGGKFVFILADSLNAYERGDFITRKGSNKDPTNSFLSMFSYQLKRVKCILVAKMCKSVRCCEHATKYKRYFKIKMVIFMHSGFLKGFSEVSLMPSREYLFPLFP